MHQRIAANFVFLALLTFGGVLTSGLYSLNLPGLFIVCPDAGCNPPTYALQGTTISMALTQICPYNQCVVLVAPTSSPPTFSGTTDQNGIVQTPFVIQSVTNGQGTATLNCGANFGTTPTPGTIIFAPTYSVSVQGTSVTTVQPVGGNSVCNRPTSNLYGGPTWFSVAIGGSAYNGVFNFGPIFYGTGSNGNQFPVYAAGTNGACFTYTGINAGIAPPCYVAQFLVCYGSCPSPLPQPPQAFLPPPNTLVTTTTSTVIGSSSTLTSTTTNTLTSTTTTTAATTTTCTGATYMLNGQCVSIPTTTTTSTSSTISLGTSTTTSSTTNTFGNSNTASVTLTSGIRSSQVLGLAIMVGATIGLVGVNRKIGDDTT